MRMTKFIFLTSVLLISCGYISAQQLVPRDTLITISRGPCYGTCPVYELKISADGAVKFEMENTKDYKIVSRTRVKSRISQEKLKELISEFERVKFFSLENKYGSQDYHTDKNCPEIWTDLSTVTTSIRINGKTKTVEHYLGCQGNPVLERLINLEYKIDEIANIEQWIEEWRRKQMNESSKPN